MRKKVDRSKCTVFRLAFNYEAAYAEMVNPVNTLTTNLRINNYQDASNIQNVILSRNSTCFGHLLCPSSGVINCTLGNWYVSCSLCGRCLGESGWTVPIIRSYQLYTWQLVCFRSDLNLLGSGHINCMKHNNCHVYS